MGACWQHVRHVPGGESWHPATDLMRGTDVYGEEGVGEKAWSIQFNHTIYDQVLTTQQIKKIVTVGSST